MSNDLSDKLELPATALRAPYPDESIPASTEQIDPLDRVVGQDRALEAIEFGLKVDADGYNIAVAGVTSSGRTSAALMLVEASAITRESVPDWCYLHNFDDPYRPRAVSLPPGTGGNLKRDLTRLIEISRTELPRAFESGTYQERTAQALEPVTRKREAIMGSLRESADSLGFMINITTMGIQPVPKGGDGAPMTPEVVRQLSDESRQRLEDAGRQLQEVIQDAVREIRKQDVEAREAIDELNNEVAGFVMGPVCEDLRRRYDSPDLRRHFDAVEKDIIENIGVLMSTPESPQERARAVGVPGPQSDPREAIFQRYEVNLFVTHANAAAGGAPVVHETQPTYYNLFGRLDYQPRFGSMTTDFTLIRPGALHAANGGFLILNAEELLTDPRSWVKLKRTLKNKQVRVEDIGEAASPIPVANLMPEPIPLQIKVILIGTSQTIAVLQALDPEFTQAFKIRADFEPDSAADLDAIRSYAGFVRRSCDTCTLRHFNRSGLREVLRFGNRLSGRQDRLTARFGAIQDICEEANQVAAQEDSAIVTGAHVQKALQAMSRRAGLVPDRLKRMIAEGTLHIETRGSQVGQVNGLAVYTVGDHAFGTAMRITCRVGAGSLGVVNIEREVERSGAIHSKGVLVLSGYLMGTFGRKRPLSFTASLTFEQSYDEVDGDSASSAELYAILTSLANLPIRQDVAVTGSVDQFGRIQPVGGVAEKVEGFFDVCRAAGLTGSQGVILPAPNTINLTLRDDVVQAVEDGQFHLWAVSCVEEGLELLTGVAAGEPGADGYFAEGTVFHGVVQALEAMEPLPQIPGVADGWARDAQDGPAQSDRAAGQPA